MNMRRALAQSPVKQASRDEGNGGLRITVTRQASEYYKVVATVQGTVYLSEMVVDEQAVELVLWERLRMSSILFEPAQTLLALVPVQASPSPSTIEQLAAEHQLGTLQKTYKQDRAASGNTWLYIVTGLLFLGITLSMLSDNTMWIWVKLLVIPLMLLISLGPLWGGLVSLRSIIKINSQLRENADETRNNFYSILLYEQGLVSNEWIESNGTWKNQFLVIHWNDIGYLQSSQDIQPSGTREKFVIKTKDGHTVDISLGERKLATTIEQCMNATIASAS